MTNVTFHAKKPDGSPLDGSHCRVNFQLVFTGPNVPIVPGVTMVPQTYIDVEPTDPDGAGAVELYGNDLIEVGGVLGNSRWRVTFYIDNVAQPSKMYDITGTDFSLDDSPPVDNIPPLESPSLPPFAIVVNVGSVLQQANEEVFRMSFGDVAHALTVPSGFGGSSFSNNPANFATADSQFIVNGIKDGTPEQIGTAIVHPDGTCSYATTDGDQFTFRPDDVFQVVGPAAPDVNLSNFTFTFVLGRS